MRFFDITDPMQLTFLLVDAFLKNIFHVVELTKESIEYIFQHNRYTSKVIAPPPLIKIQTASVQKLPCENQRYFPSLSVDSSHFPGIQIATHASGPADTTTMRMLHHENKFVVSLQYSLSVDTERYCEGKSAPGTSLLRSILLLLFNI